jgi:glyoxylase-like metal-dependent hydrolase (beta-lactamase superfamily II)
MIMSTQPRANSSLTAGSVVVRTGETTIHRIEEIYGPGFRASALFSEFDAGIFDSHPELQRDWGYDVANTRPMAGIQTFAFRHRGKLVLVDTGAGNGKSRAPEFPTFDMLDTPFLQRLRDAGVDPQEVDYVFCTHIHVDHVGWNTHLADGEWRATFPRARHIIGRAEFDHWSDGGAGLKFMPLGTRVMEDSVLPLVEQGLVDFVEPGDEILQGLRVGSVPGHTAHQLSLTVDTGERPVIFVADAFHQPAQIMRPNWSTRYCEAPDQSSATRRQLLEMCAATGAVMVPAHFGRPYACTVERAADAYRIGLPPL